MAFQAKTWGWKGMAARLLLVPVLAGSAATAAAQGVTPPAVGAVPGGTAGSTVSNVEKARALVAQAKQALDKGDLATAERLARQAQELRATLSYSEARPETILTEIAKRRQKTSPTAVARTSDPKELMRLGQQAIAAGQLDKAQEYARQADTAASARGYKWGLFEDTPGGLMKDVQEARAKADRAQSAELFKKARTLASQPAKSDAERAQNLDQALNMAYQAKNLHGPYSLWDFGEKPDRLIQEIEASKTALRKKGPAGGDAVAARTPAAQSDKMTPAVTTAAATTRPGSGVQPAGGPAPVAPSVPLSPAVAQAAGSAKEEVARLVAEGRALLAQDKVVEARAKADEARKLAAERGLAAAFGPAEDTPDQLFQAAQAKGNQMIQALTRSADEQLAAKKPENAAAALDMAEKLSAGLGLYAKPIAERKAKLAGVMPAAPAAPGIAVVGAPPAAPNGEYLVPAESVTLSGNGGGRMLLAQAEQELKRGDLEMAKRIAIQAHNADPAAKADAQAILRTIDAEETAVKRREAATALQNGLTAYAGKDYEQALGVLKLIDPAYLPADQKARVAEVMTDCLAKTEKADRGGVAQAAGTDEPIKPKPGGLAEQQKAMADVAFQKLRQDGFDAMNAAKAAWERGETDAAVRLLEEYTAKVKASNQSAARQRNLLQGIENRLDGYSKLKHNMDVLVKEAADKQRVRTELITKNVAEAQKQDEIKRKVAEVHSLTKGKKYKEAEGLALQVKQLDPDDPTLTAIYEQAKMLRRKEDFAKIRDGQEEMFRLGLNEAEKQGPVPTGDNPLMVNPERSLLAARRGEELYQRARTPVEMRIEQTLGNSFSLKFDRVPLSEAIAKVRSESKLNISIDDASLGDEKISLDDVVVTEELKDLPLRNALAILLEKARLTFVIEDNVVKVTTKKRSQGRLTTKVFHVMDLVTPIPEFGLSPHQTLSTAIQASRQLQGLPGGANNGPTPFVGSGGLGGAQMVGGQAGQPGGTPNVPGVPGGQLQSAATGSQQAMAPSRGAYASQLKKLITGMVRPMAWQDMGGPGAIEYYDIGGAMVVNQTADVIGEVAQLLESLRRLQDLSVSVEIRVISLSEAFFERVGVDFQMNLKTNNTTFERMVATSSFRPEPFLNDINVKNTLVGWSPATGFTSDLDVPIRATSYGLSLPPFGGYQTSLGPTTNGGLSLGLAFLNDIQVYMFLEAAQGNRRVNVMQAPKITLFNGQTSTVFVGDVAFFTTNVQAFNAGGQFVYLPTNQAFPIGNGFDPNGTGQQGGVTVTVQAVISADRRFVRLNLSPSLTALASATVPLFPVTTFVTPVFEGGSQGQPIPFTQFFQQPSFTEISAQTTVAVPDGGTVLLGGLKTLSQGRNEFGPPVLSQVPYLNRLFKNVGIGQETRHVMLMVTPRIIINSEEEVRQTGEVFGGLAPQP